MPTACICDLLLATEFLRSKGKIQGISKVNQIGTMTEAIEVVKMAKDSQWGLVISQRSGETDDCFIADLAVDLATGQIKAVIEMVQAIEVSCRRGMHTLIRDAQTTKHDFVFYADRLIRLLRHTEV
ncbi:hypothetical protein L2E82_49095 [Cichorium intybus]|uniref:Uncharacterized protein n=1 Tax=Cichorium intybus TaxID=13427 RepID=A0ACB8YZU4_CICIN|nr:hypothetical protein L2E82_49095 [Cichorium intybus]